MFIFVGIRFVAIDWFRRLWLLPAATGILSILFLGLISLASDDGVPSSVPKVPDVSDWIDELGADTFATREAAQQKLIDAGLGAFDQIQRATASDDLEVRGRARFILEQLRRQVAWVPPDAPARVRAILENYEAKSNLSRKVRVILLSDVAEEGGAEPLCQIARYDSDERVAKAAALAILESYQCENLSPADVALREKLLRVLQGGQRPSVNWLRGYLTYLKDQQWDAVSVAKWLQSESQLLRDNSPDTDFDLAFRLATSLVSRTGEQPAQVTDVVKQMISITTDFSEPQLIKIVDWLVQQQEYAMAVELIERNAGRLGHPLSLACRLADALWCAGEREKAEETASKTMARDKQSFEEHLDVAQHYSRRGQFDWAHAEYGQLMEEAGEKTAINIWARSLRSEMLHDQGEDEQAATMLEPAVGWIEHDKKLWSQMGDEGLRTANQIKSRWQFFTSLHDHQKQDYQAERKLLAMAMESNPLDADVLIAMYHLSDSDEAWLKKTRAKIGEAASQFRSEIGARKKELKQLEVSLSQTQNESANIQQARLDLYRRARRNLATSNNQLAWLVANTEGDFDEAVRLSRESIRLSPRNAGLLDTLGRCYFAAGDLQSAIKYQKQAVALEPHSRAIQGQLDLFQAANAEEAQAVGEETR